MKLWRILDLRFDMKRKQKNENIISFSNLVEAVQKIHNELAKQARFAVNISLTLRNCLIGRYIHEYELHGSDRAKYGENLIDMLAISLGDIPRTQKRELNRYRLFYKTYPQIGETLSPQLIENLNLQETTVIQIGEAVSPQLNSSINLCRKLSFSHFDLLIVIDDAAKRAFYEIECMRGN